MFSSTNNYTRVLRKIFFTSARQIKTKKETGKQNNNEKYDLALSLGVKRPGHEADHSPQSSAKVKNAWSYTSTPPIRLHGVVLS
jgi:hypothetical protein